MRLTEEELASLQPTDEKTIYLEHFLDPAIVDLVLFAGQTRWRLLIGTDLWSAPVCVHFHHRSTSSFWPPCEK